MPHSDTKPWAGTTYGNTWMHKSLTAALRVINVRLVYVFAAVFVVPFCLFGHSRKIIWQYLRRHGKYPRLKAVWLTYRNHCLFSQVVIDRFAMYAGKKFDIRIEGYAHFERLAKQEGGFVCLSAHVGNYELAGYSLVAEDKPMNVLVYGGEKASVMNARTEMFGRSRIKMLSIQADMSHLFVLNEALANGEIVSMPADRVWGSPKTVTLEFMGGKAAFPAGPFRVAVMRGSAVLAVNVMKTRARQYTIHVTPLHYNPNLRREEQATGLAREYARELEGILRRYPAQWYNYFDFWKEDI